VNEASIEIYLAGSSVRRVEASSKPGWLGSVCHQLLRGKQSGSRRSASTLSKALWKGTAVDTIWRHTELVGAQLRLGTRIVALDRASKMVVDAAGNAFGYDRLLLATGRSGKWSAVSLPDALVWEWSDAVQGMLHVVGSGHEPRRPGAR
jgi:hypothetical protein